jgi:hypothetical protein
MESLSCRLRLMSMNHLLCDNRTDRLMICERGCCVLDRLARLETRVHYPTEFFEHYLNVVDGSCLRDPARLKDGSHTHKPPQQGVGDFRVPDKYNKGVWSLVCTKTFPPFPCSIQCSCGIVFNFFFLRIHDHTGESMTPSLQSR